MAHDELVKRLKVKLTNASIGDRMYERPVSWEEADTLLDLIEQQAAEIERMREALELADAALRGANMDMGVVERKVRAALGDTQ